MPTPAKGYRLKDGTRVPGTTTILSRFKESGALIHWSWNLAHEPLAQIRAILRNGADPEAIARFLAIPDEASDYRAVRDKAADAGTIAHDMVDSWIHGRTFDPEPYTQLAIEMALPAFEAFRRWTDQSHLEVVETEMQLVSEKYRFGGTRDAILVNGKRAIGDWKTSKDIYPEMALQLASYGILDEEHGHKIDGGYHLLKFSKQENPDDPVRFSHHYWSQLDVAREAFLTMRSLYDLMQRVSKITA